MRAQTTGVGGIWEGRVESGDEDEEEDEDEDEEA